MKKPKFISIMVIISLLLCVIYGGTAVLFQYYTGEELSPTLTENWF
jgi:flagellar basal body-associated protein FliL